MSELDTPHTLHNWAKSIWTGGALGGLMSLFPFLNFLNLFFLFWLIVAGAVAVFQLLRHNPALRPSEALLTGAMSGLIGGSLFSLVTGFFFLTLTPEKIDQLLARTRWLTASVEQNFQNMLQSGRFRVLVIVALALFVLLAIVAGSVGGILSRTFLASRAQKIHE